MNKMLLLTVFLFLNQSNAYAKIEGETRLVLKSVMSRYQRLGNWTAKFTQHVQSLGLKGSFSQGEFYFVEPEKFKYSLKGPEFSDFVSNGKKAWHINYRQGKQSPPEVKIFSNVKKLDLNRYLIFLRGLKLKNEKSYDSLEKDFKVTGKKNGETLILTLAPKGESDISEIQMIFNNAIEAPSEISITDLLGTITKIKIASFEKIKKIDKNIFQPEIPKNAKTQQL